MLSSLLFPCTRGTKTKAVVRGGGGGLSPPKILVQYIIIYNRIHVDVIVLVVPQIEHIPVLQAARKFRTRKCHRKKCLFCYPEVLE